MIKDFYFTLLGIFLTVQNIILRASGGELISPESISQLSDFAKIASNLGAIIGLAVAVFNLIYACRRILKKWSVGKDYGKEE